VSLCNLGLIIINLQTPPALRFQNRCWWRGKSGKASLWWEGLSTAGQKRIFYL